MARLIKDEDGELVLRIDWCVEDVRSCAYEDVSDEDCVNILHFCAQIHDANVGMSWEVIKSAASYYMAQKELVSK